MFFYASKILWFFATPSNLLVVLTLLGALLASGARTRRFGRALAIAGAASLLILGISPAASWLMRPLETRFPPVTDQARPVAGFIVLGGALAPDNSTALGQPVLNEAGERIVAALDLARRFPGARIVLPGGSGRLVPEDFTEADVTARFLEERGVARERIVVENRSRTTAENAAFTRQLVAPQPGERWLLVTSAWHMPRSVAVFRHEGFPVEAYPVDFRTVGGAELGRPFGTVSEGLRRFDVAAKEWIGLAGYRLSGRSRDWLPGPEAGPPGPQAPEASGPPGGGAASR